MVILVEDLNSRKKLITTGRIQLQSEGTETYFRNISIEPIDRLPKVRAN